MSPSYASKEKNLFKYAQLQMNLNDCILFTKSDLSKYEHVQTKLDKRIKMTNLIVPRNCLLFGHVHL